MLGGVAVGVAARGARAAAGADAADRRADGLCRERLGRAGPDRSVPGRAPEARMDGGPQHPDRHSLGDTYRRGGDATIREGTRRATARPHSFEHHTHHDRAAATNAHHPHRFRDSRRSDRQRLRSELPAAGRQRHRFHHSRAARWAASGWSCSRRLRRASIGSRSCSTRQRRHMPNIT